jgi:hypothetical protein
MRRHLLVGFILPFAFLDTSPGQTAPPQRHRPARSSAILRTSRRPGRSPVPARPLAGRPLRNSRCRRQRRTRHRTTAWLKR